MAIAFHPKPGAVLVCDYDTGFRPPEMVKRRLCIVVSPRLRRRDGLCAVVPLSTTAPRFVEAYHLEIDLDVALPKPWLAARRWAKCDLLATVGFGRLTAIGTGRAAGRRNYIYPHLDADQLRDVRAGVLAGLGLQKLTPHL